MALALRWVGAVARPGRTGDRCRYLAIVQGPFAVMARIRLLWF